MFRKLLNKNLGRSVELVPRIGKRNVKEKSLKVIKCKSEKKNRNVFLAPIAVEILTL